MLAKQSGVDRHFRKSKRLLILLALTVFAYTGLAEAAKRRIDQFNTFKNTQNYEAALRVMREEIADPAVKTGAYLADIRALAINALQHYADVYGLKPGMDEEAQRYYKEGLRYAGADQKRQTQLHHVMANYYSWSGRNGLAIPYLRKDLAYWKKVNNQFQIIIGYHGLASVYGDMGQLEMEDHYREKALALAKKYFVRVGGKPSDENEWLQYKKILNSRMDDIAAPGASDEILKLWAIMEPIVQRYIVPKYISYLNVAELLAISGDADRAMQFMEQAKQVAQKEGARMAPVDMACKGAHIMARLGNYGQVLANIRQCFDYMQYLERKIGPVIYRVAAEGHEHAGNLEKAVKFYRQSSVAYEGLRSSFAVAERAAFFRSTARRPYWGLIRALTRRYLKSGNETDFVAALEASEMVRGRQFGELMQKRKGARAVVSSLGDLRASIGLDEIVLDYMSMDKHIILFAFTRNSHRAFIIPYDRMQFREQVLALARALSTPASSIKAINDKLKRISHQMLAPVRAMAKGKRYIVILPDGVLNTLPFDLLSLDETGYRPMIENKIVTAMPSLKFMLAAKTDKRQRKTRGLFALADPVYAKAPKIAGLTQTEMRAASRGVNYMAYFAPLPETRMEVEHIARHFDKEPVEIMLGNKVRESKLKKLDLKPYRYLHLATHGILGKEVPGIGEPALVLSEEKGEDGFLTASEAARLRINADLTVLSACNTGSGKYFTGEGVMGMSRSFLLAGSRAVMVSLWQVASLETAELMVVFYRHLRSGMGAAEALRQAKLGLMKGKTSAVISSGERGLKARQRRKSRAGLAHPYYWAPFILIGQ